jgi:phenylpropionate dioxygenase-like ring-hydroxylating dioxygenase large terminal subunit
MQEALVKLQGVWGEDAPDYVALLDEWHAVARSSELGDGQVMKVRLLAQDVVLWRGEGTVHAWDDYCIHRGARLSQGWVVDNCKLVCPYHGWQYDGTARCVKIPAHPTQPPPLKARAFPFHALEEYGLIWVCIGEPRDSLPPFPEWTDKSFRKVHAGPYHFKANSLRAIENFLDVTHFPYVHGGLNGDPQNPDEIKDYQVTVGDDGIRTGEIKVFQPYGDHRGIPVDAIYKFHCAAPGTAYFNKDTGEGNIFCTLLTTTPVDEAQCIVWLIVAINFGWELTEEKILDRQDRVFAQDQRAVESQRPARLPLDLTEEMHIRSDRLQIEYRKWIRRLGDDAARRRADNDTVHSPRGAKKDASTNVLIKGRAA